MGASPEGVSSGRRVVPRLAVAIAAAMVVVGVALAWRSYQEFRVERVTYQRFASDGWEAPGADPLMFGEVNLPHFHAGYYRLEFTSTASFVEVDVYARDCLMEAYLDGELVFERDKDSCGNCSFVGKRRCGRVVLDLDFGEPGPHVLALRTHNVWSRDYKWSRDFKTLWVEYEKNAAGWRALALFGFAFLLTIGVMAFRRRSLERGWSVMVATLWRYRYVLVAAAVVMSLRVVVSRADLTGDVSQATMVYVEHIVNADSWRLTKLDPVYTAAKHSGTSYMHKPPGLYYQYLPARLIFGFTYLYYVYLARLPGIIGDFLIAIGLFIIVRRKTGEDWLANLAAITYLAAPGPFMFFGYVGRVDALPIAFLLFAANNMHRNRFSLYFGLSALHKQFAVFAGPWFLFRPGMARKVVLAAVFTLVCMAPYLLDDPGLVFERMVSPQLTKAVSGLTWMHNLTKFGVTDLSSVASAITVGYVVVLLCLSPFLSGDPHRVIAWIYVSFVLFARNMAEHYLLWPAPFLIAYAFIGRRAFPLLIFGVLQMSGFMLNDANNMLPKSMRHDFALAQGIILALYVALELPQIFRPRESWRRWAEALNQWRAQRSERRA